MADRIDVVRRHLTQTSQNVSPSFTSSPALSADFTYSLDKPLLSKEQRAFYDKNGYLVIRKLVKSEDLDIYRQRFEDVCNRKVSSAGMTVMRDVAISKSEFVAGQQAITKLQEFQHDDVLFGYCKHPEVVKYAKCFAGDDMMAMHTMLINKPPDPGLKTSRHPMHQDLHYFPFRPANKIVCSWTAMQTVNRENGCLVVLPGTHKGELLEHVYPNWEGGVNKMYVGIKNYTPADERIHLPMEEGDTVFFHPLLIHGSGMNRTQGFRKSISCHYANSRCDYIDVHGTNQQPMEDEVREVVKRRLGSDADEAILHIKLKDIWRAKGRLVCGDVINL